MAFRGVGWDVRKIHLSPADALFWDRSPADRFSGDVSAWKAYLRSYLETHFVSCVLMYADRLPYHQAAIEVCKTLQVPVRVVENGYLRPDWITCEVDGMGRYSRLPKDPETIRASAVRCPKPDMTVKYAHRFFDEAWREVAFHLSNGLTPRSIWRFDHGKYYHPVLDYLAFAAKMARSPLSDWTARRICARFLLRETPFYFVPLQVQSDYAVRDNSDFGHIEEMIEAVARSFAAQAPETTRLLFKTHPHDNGYENFPRRVRRIARRHGISARVSVVESGPFGTLCAAAKGVVVINSTSGLHAIRAFKPVIALGDAVYDVPGLTHQRGLDSFWRDPDEIDADLARAFTRLLAATVQVKGSFFNAEGRAIACREIAARVTGVETVPEHNPDSVSASAAGALNLKWSVRATAAGQVA